MIKINLVPQELLDREVQKQRLAQVSVAAGFLAIIFLGISFTHYYKGVALEKRLVEAEAEFKRLEAIVKQVEELEAKAKAVKSRLDVIQDLLVARSFYPRFMTELLKNLGEGVWLVSLAATGSPTDLAVSMACQATGLEAATAWLRHLQASPTFKDPSLGAITLAADGLVTFPMQLKYRPDASAVKK